MRQFEVLEGQNEILTLAERIPFNITYTISWANEEQYGLPPFRSVSKKKARDEDYRH